MSWKGSLAALLALIGVSAGCATTSDPYDHSASPGAVGSPVRTDAPQIDNADAAGAASVPGTHTGVWPTIITPASPAASPVIIVPSPAESPVIVVPPAQPR